MLRRVAAGVAVVLDQEASAGPAVQRAGDPADHTREHRVVLPVVRAGVAVAGVVRRHAVVAEIDAERGVPGIRLPAIELRAPAISTVTPLRPFREIRLASPPAVWPADDRVGGERDLDAASGRCPTVVGR